MTGVVILIADLAYLNNKKSRKNSVSDSHLDKNRDKIGKGDYNSDIYFK